MIRVVLFCVFALCANSACASVGASVLISDQQQEPSKITVAMVACKDTDQAHDFHQAVMQLGVAQAEVMYLTSFGSGECGTVNVLLNYAFFQSCHSLRVVAKDCEVVEITLLDGSQEFAVFLH